MILDPSELPAGETVETDICIVGSGPAGITLAKEFMGGDFRVIVLEGGDREPDEATQSLCDGETGEPDGPYQLRARRLGGTAHRWGIKVGKPERHVRYAALHDVDFEKRDWLPHSGWPFDRNHLLPFYERAQKLCHIGPFNYDGSAWEEGNKTQLKFTEDRVTSSVFQFGPRNLFTEEYPREVGESPNINIYIKSNVINLETDEANRSVTRVKAVTLDGQHFWVKAKLFILATGGLENARLLLMSDEKQKNGVGNEHDLVGRYFMDHYIFSGGILVPETKKIFDHLGFYDIHDANDVPIVGYLSLTEETLRREEILGTGIFILPKHKAFPAKKRADRSCRMLKNALAKKTPIDIPKHAGNVIGGNIYHNLDRAYRKVVTRQPAQYTWIAEGGWAGLADMEKRFDYIDLVFYGELAPDPHNRVRLSDELDRLGCRKIKIEQRYTDIDLRSIARTQEILAEQFEISGMGKLEVDPDEVEYETSLSLINASAHHTGSTRMHPNPKEGVVDENCRVHSVDNLFLAGSSVFPTAGYANPTLTIIALSLRLADHIKTLVCH